MLGIFGLDQHFARTLGAARATCNLDNGLCQSLGRTKVGAEESLIGIEHHHQGE